MLGFIKSQSDWYYKKSWELNELAYQMQKLTPGKKPNAMCKSAFIDLQKHFKEMAEAFKNGRLRFTVNFK